MRTRTLLLLLCFLTPLGLTGCADMTHTQKGAAYGAAAGAVAGQIIGSSTSATLIGAGVGALGGALINDYRHKDDNK